MAILVQEQVKTAYSFIVHTKDPFTATTGIYAELAVGLGETLASGNQSGVPYKLTSDESESVTVRGFANYSQAVTSCGLRSVDYSKAALSNSLTVLPAIGKRLVKIASYVEGVYSGVP